MYNNSREHILNRVKAAASGKSKFLKSADEVDFKSEIYFKQQDSPETIFAEEFGKVNGTFVFCESKKKLFEKLQEFQKEQLLDAVFCIDKDIQQLLIKAGVPFDAGKDDFAQMQAGVTTCEYLIARTGSIMVSSKQVSGRLMNIFPPVHVVIAFTSQLVYDLEDAISGITGKYREHLPSMITTITGPSRTADIEKTLILGAHGPKKLVVFLIKERGGK